jgi:hypothetical protein
MRLPPFLWILRVGTRFDACLLGSPRLSANLSIRCFTTNCFCLAMAMRFKSPMEGDARAGVLVVVEDMPGGT